MPINRFKTDVGVITSISSKDDLVFYRNYFRRSAPYNGIRYWKFKRFFIDNAVSYDVHYVGVVNFKVRYWEIYKKIGPTRVEDNTRIIGHFEKLAIAPFINLFFCGDIDFIIKEWVCGTAKDH